MRMMKGYRLMSLETRKCSFETENSSHNLVGQSKPSDKRYLSSPVRIALLGHKGLGYRLYRL
jgi:hypothetical protein